MQNSAKSNVLCHSIDIMSKLHCLSGMSEWVSLWSSHDGRNARTLINKHPR